MGLVTLIMIHFFIKNNIQICVILYEIALFILTTTNFFVIKYTQIT